MDEKIVNLEKAKEVIDNGMEKASDLLQNPESVEKLVEKVQTKIKDVPILENTLNNATTMVSMVKSYINKEYTDVSPKVIATLVSSFLYVVTKKDIIPDDIPILGIIDDIAVLGVALKFVEPELKAYASWRLEHPEEKK